MGRACGRLVVAEAASEDAGGAIRRSSQGHPGVLRNALNFAGIKYSEDRIEPAVEASRFQELRAVEDHLGLNPKAGDPNERFIREGRVGNWQEEMGYVELRLIEESMAR